MSGPLRLGEDLTAWRTFFMMAAFFNAAVATVMLAAPDRVANHLSIAGAGSSYVVAMLGVLIGAFGVGYAVVARKPTRNRAIVWSGMVGKLGIVLLGAMQFAAGTIEFRFFALGLGDLVFAGLFGLFLAKNNAGG